MNDQTALAEALMRGAPRKAGDASMPPMAQMQAPTMPPQAGNIPPELLQLLIAELMKQQGGSAAQMPPMPANPSAPQGY
jgi:hypothetical protein